MKNPFKTHRKSAIAGLVVGLVAATGGVALAYFTSPGTGTGSAQVANPSNLLINQLGGTPMYNSTADPTSYQYSQCFYCVGMGEFGNRINLANGGGPLSDVVVAMTNFGTQAGSINLTMKIFNDGTGTAPGSLIASDTQSFTVPVTATGYDPGQPNDGLAFFNATFDFSSQNVTLPGTVVYELQYNDASSTVTGGVNVQLANETTQVSVGTDADPGNLFLALASTANGDGYTATGQDVAPGEVTCSTGSTTFTEYSTASCNNGAQGYGTPAYVPAVEFDTSTMGDLYPGGPSEPVNFSITNPGTSPATVQSVTIAVASDAGNGFVESSPGNTSSDITGCYASWFTIDPATDSVGATIQPGSTVDWIGTASISMPQSTSNQDACKGASVGLTFSSN